MSPSPKNREAAEAELEASQWRDISTAPKRTTAVTAPSHAEMIAVVRELAELHESLAAIDTAPSRPHATKATLFRAILATLEAKRDEHQRGFVAGIRKAADLLEQNEREADPRFGPACLNPISGLLEYAVAQEVLVPAPPSPEGGDNDPR